MMTKKKPLFAFDLRIQKQLAKLCVYEDDFLEDVIKRFSKLAKLGQNFHNKIKDKLQNQLKKLLQKNNCSQRIRDKIQSFLEQSKIIIIGVTQTQNQQYSHTPYKALKENSFPQRKTSSENIKQHLFSSQNISPRLIKYASKQILVEQQDQSSIQQILQKYTQRQNYNQKLLISQEYTLTKPESKYLSNKQDETTLQMIRNNRIARSQQRQKRCEKVLCQNQEGNQYRKQHSSLYNNSKHQQQIASYESYQSYKENHNKKYKSNQPSAQSFQKIQSNEQKMPRQCLKRVYPSNNSNLTDLKKDYCFDKSIFPPKNIKSFKYDDGFDYRTKFDYDKCMQAKGVSGGFKQNKKFKYLGQPC